MDKEEELVPVEHGLHGSVVLGAFDGSLGQAFADFLDGGCAITFAHVVAQGFLHLVGDILHTDKDRGGEARVGQFLVHVVGPETVAQVVVLHGRMFLQLSVAAVVVGAHQTLVGDNFAGAEMPEGASGIAQTDNGVLQAVLVHAVDVLRRQFETGFLHVAVVLAYQREKPHALVGAGRSGQHQGYRECDNQSTNFHCFICFCY